MRERRGAGGVEGWRGGAQEWKQKYLISCDSDSEQLFVG